MNEIFVIYLGEGGAYVEGIPARDLTFEEWSRLRASLQQFALATRLYQIAKKVEPDSVTTAVAVNARQKEKGA